jgi:hypothetical protein
MISGRSASPPAHVVPLAQEVCGTCCTLTRTHLHTYCILILFTCPPVPCCSGPCACVAPTHRPVSDCPPVHHLLNPSPHAASHSTCRGQNISSPHSHKSYRPLTILCFRTTHLLWSQLVALLPPLLPWARQWQHQPRDLTPSATGQAQQLPGVLHPLPFHAASVVLHGVVSVMVLW